MLATSGRAPAGETWVGVLDRAGGGVSVHTSRWVGLLLVRAGSVVTLSAFVSALEQGVFGSWFDRP